RPSPQLPGQTHYASSSSFRSPLIHVPERCERPFGWSARRHSRDAAGDDIKTAGRLRRNSGPRQKFFERSEEKSPTFGGDKSRRAGRQEAVKTPLRSRFPQTHDPLLALALAHQQDLAANRVTARHPGLWIADPPVVHVRAARLHQPP